MDRHQGEVIAKLFYLLTAVFEDGAGLAVDGQAPDIPDDQCQE